MNTQRLTLVLLVFVGLLSPLRLQAASSPNALAATATARPSHAFVMSNTASRLYVQVFKDQSALAAGLSHDHVVRADGWSGTIAFDPDAPHDCRVDITIPVVQLRVDEPELRRHVGYEAMLDDGDRRKVRESMLDDDQLDAKQYPSIRVQGRACAADAQRPNGWHMALTVTIRGRSKTLVTPIELVLDNDTLRASGELDVTHDDFGIKPFSAFFGAVRNAQPLKFVAHVVAKRAQAP